MLRSGTRLGPYEILGAIGAGGMGEVYRARDARLDRDVAIKVVAAQLAADPAVLARFEREALSVAKLSHPNVVAIYEFGRTESTTFVVTELVEGETLRERLSHGALSPRRAIGYAQQIARGLAAAHARGIVHRDLKPENVMIGRDDQVKILDFGLAKPLPAATDETQAAEIRTNTGVILGTCAYMAPEQVRGQHIDHRADIFAFGAVLYEMLSGTRAFRGDTAADTMTAVLSKEPPEFDASNVAVPTVLNRIVRRCLEKEAELRFQSANDLAFALETVSSTTTPAQGIAGVAAPVAGRWRRLAAIAAMLAAVAGASYFVARLQLAPAASANLPTFTRLTFRRGFTSAARFVNEGEGVIYAAAWDDVPLSVYAVGIQRPRAEAPPILRGSLAAVSRSGDMAIKIDPALEGLFIERGTLAEVPLAGGQPRALLEAVDDADYAPDGRIAVVRTVGGRSRLEFPAGSVLYESAGWIGSPRFSLDGKQLAFMEHPLRGDNRGWVSLVDVSSHGNRHLTDEFGTLSGLAWVPAANEVCFGSFGAIHCAALTTGRVRTVARIPLRLRLLDIAGDGRLLISTHSLRTRQIGGDSGGREVDLSWQEAARPIQFSRDGSRLLFGTAGYDIYLRAVAGTPPVRLGDGAPTAVSPDDRWISAILPGVPTKLAIVPTGAGEVRTLPRGTIDSHNWAAWMPDGKRVVITGNERGRGSRLFLQSIDGGDPVVFSGEGVRLPQQCARPVSPDGRVVIAEDPDGVAALYPIDGGEPQRIAALATDLMPLGWSDTPNVIYARPQIVSQTTDIFRVDVVSGRRDRVRTVGPTDPTGAPRVIAAQVAADGRHYAYSTRESSMDLYVVAGVLNGAAK